MAKMIKYKVLSCELNHGTEENPDIEQVICDMGIECKTQADFDANYPIAEKEAIPGTIDISGEFDSEPEPEPEPIIPSDDSSVWDELDTAYQEGVDSV